jgi:beta-glucosidase-like glycosyl hydrolase
MRAYSNAVWATAGLAAWGPTLNIIRDPRVRRGRVLFRSTCRAAQRGPLPCAPPLPQWGRNQETVSEDPWLSGQYAAAVTAGLQRGDGSGGDVVQALSTLKHLTAYSLEQYTDPRVNMTWTRQVWGGERAKEGSR